MINENEELKKIIEYINSNNNDLSPLTNQISSYVKLKYFSNLPANILTVCELNPTDECLEIGSSCGQLTEYISDHTKRIDCIEISKDKTYINQRKNINKTNISYYQDIKKIKNKYDKIFLIGTLNNSKDYFPKDLDTDNKLLLFIKDHLKPNGYFYLAIDNKYGIKYFAGIKEEESNQLFYSIENNSKYSNLAIKNLLKATGFKHYFYYPIPNYVQATVIYSEDYLPSSTSLHFQNKDYKNERYILFNEEKAINEAIKSNHFETFTNSYLIKCWL